MLKDLAPFLDCSDVLMIPKAKISFLRGVLFREGEIISENCEESILFLLRSKYVSDWYAKLWFWKREDETYQDGSESNLYNKIVQDLLNNKEYNSRVISNLNSLSEEEASIVLEKLPIPFHIPLMVYADSDYIIDIGSQTIQNGILYIDGRQETRSFGETLKTNIDALVVPVLKIGEESLTLIEIPEMVKIWPKFLPGYKKRFLERLHKIPEVFQRQIMLSFEEKVIPYGIESPRTVREFYAKDCKEDTEIKECLCIPYESDKKECSFSNEPLVTEEKEKMRILSAFEGSRLSAFEGKPGPIPPEALAYIEEYPVFVLKKGTTICHSTMRNLVLKRDAGKNFVTTSSLGWWNKYLVGQKRYGGGWFTYETNYGGPGFGILLYYKVMEDIPLLFVPNYRIHKDDPAYFPDKDRPWGETMTTQQFSGSHLVQGPKNWKEKGFRPIVAEYYADEFARRLLELGFPGYISCDECEVFLTHETMKKALYNRPYRIRYETRIGQKNYREDPEFPTVFDLIIETLCPNPQECPLEIKEGHRDEETLDVSIPIETIERIMPLERFTQKFEEEK